MTEEKRRDWVMFGVGVAGAAASFALLFLELVPAWLGGLLIVLCMLFVDRARVIEFVKSVKDMKGILRK